MEIKFEHKMANVEINNKKMALCQELGLTKNNKDADAVKGKLALDCIVAFKRLQKT